MLLLLQSTAEGGTLNNERTAAESIVHSIDQINSLSNSSRHNCELASTQTSPVCPDWEKRFAESQKEISDYRSAIEETLKSINSGRFPSCDSSDADQANRKDQRNTSNVKIRDGEVDLSKVDGFSSLSKKIYKFKYQVIPPGIPPQNGKPLKTVVIFAGGPGSVLSDNAAQQQQRDYQVIVADYVGMGKNAMSNIRAGVDDQNMSLDIYANLIAQVIKQEKDDHNLGDYVLWGLSFGSVAATVVGSHLSSLPDSERKYRPTGVLLGGVVSFTRASADGPSDSHSASESQGSPDKGIQWRPSVVGDRVCVLPEGKTCFDEKIFALLSPEERVAARMKISETFTGFQRDHLNTMQSFFRDAFHWEAAHSPQDAANFLRKYFLSGNSSRLYCWYKSNFSQIPWLNRETSASLMASITALNCGPYPENSDCRCFSSAKHYDSSYQIRPPTKINYLNGESDTQTPIDGALRHFELESNPNKSFLKVCHAGHLPYGPPGTLGNVDPSALLEATFNPDPKAIERIPNYCEQKSQ
jgi:pimeloyl-ACP methyl ester carboxylesterase